jgi:hypothetical protein
MKVLGGKLEFTFQAVLPRCRVKVSAADAFGRSDAKSAR